MVLALKLAPTPIADDFRKEKSEATNLDFFPVEVYLCKDCGNVQLGEVIDPEILFGEYLYETGTSLGLVEHFESYADHVLERFSGPESKFVVDVGSNDGALLRAFKRRGCKVLGIDPARAIAKKATESGIPTLAQFLTPSLAEIIVNDHSTVDLVTANNVFAHTDDMKGMANAISQMLAPDGIFIFEVSYLLDILDNYLFDTIYHEHLCYHSITSLNEFLKGHGMELFDVERIETKGGSIRGYAKRIGSNIPVSDSVDHYISVECARNLHSVDSFADLETHLEDQKMKIQTLLKKYRSEGKKIVGYGASQTCTTLGYYFDIFGFFDYVVDDNPVKHSLFYPGCGLQVHPSERMVDDQVDVAVILAWNYAQPIIRRHESGFLQSGGEFVVPMADVQVVDGPSGGAF